MSGTTKPRALILVFGIKHHLVDLYQVCSYYVPLVKKWPCPGDHSLYTVLYIQG